MAAFRPISAQRSFPKEEEKTIALWRQNNAFQRSIDQRSKERSYVFYDGPPFATGLPHYGHLVANTLKDIVPRYWSMRGYRVERRFGWDTHGLPIEMLVEKKLGLSGPSSIHEYGVSKFNEACRANVLTYTKEWEKTVERLGRWVDFKNDYKTMDPEFMESVWWVFSQLHEKGLVYEDFRVMPFSWRLSTSLSNFEANLDYRDVQDPAITVKMPLADSEDVLLIWTTTPWTLPSNLAIAVGPDIDYVRAKKEGDETVYILAKARVKAVLGKKYEVLSELKGSDLVGRRYRPLFDYFVDVASAKSFHVIASDHVTTEDGAGLVHMAPDFGEEDFNACKKAGITVVQGVDDEGRFKSIVTDYAGRNIKEADPDIIRRLKEDGRIFKHATIQHSYPFCWRSGTPLIYKAVPALFVRVEALRDRMVANNSRIHWVPEAIGKKRFGNWLADARDWNISRNRFWGCPIPLWKCPDCGAQKCIGSIGELSDLVGESIPDIHPHKIDHHVFDCDCGGEMKRIADVFDCWFESGSMPYAQDHYPFENKDRFEANYPAQFIAEGLDQTRGWFYTLLVLSTALFDKPPFENVIVNGMVLAEDGAKMSKSKQNYPPVDDVLNEFGADALRAYLINSPIVRAEPLRFKKEGVKDVIRTTLLPLVNSWSFFTQYANIDGWTPDKGLNGLHAPDYADRPELDRWILSVLQSLIAQVNEEMEGYYLNQVIPPVLSFIDHLTNWYIRRSRRRFWRSVEEEAGRLDKASAYATLYETLVTFAKVLAPILPFLSESIYQQLVVDMGMSEPGQDSVHLCDYPLVDQSRIDLDLEKQVHISRSAVSLGRALREKHRLKIRQPLSTVTLVNHDADIRAALQLQSGLIAEELNVKSVRIEATDVELTEIVFKANFKTLGRRYGKQMRDAAAAIAQFERTDFDTLQNGGEIDVLGQGVRMEDVLVRREAKADVLIETQGALLVALDSELTDELIAEGYMREVVRRIQNLRKTIGFQVTDRIDLTLFVADSDLRSALLTHGESIASEAMASNWSVLESAGGAHQEEIDGKVVGFDIAVSG